MFSLWRGELVVFCVKSEGWVESQGVSWPLCNLAARLADILDSDITCYRTPDIVVPEYHTLVIVQRVATFRYLTHRSIVNEASNLINGETSTVIICKYFMFDITKWLQILKCIPLGDKISRFHFKFNIQKVTATYIELVKMSAHVNH